MAAGNETAALVVALSAQLTQFEKDIAKAGDIADRGVRHIEDRFKSANVKIGGFEEFTSQLTKLAGLAGLTEVIHKITELNAEVAKIGEGATRVGLTTDAFQKFRFAVVSTGGSVEAADHFLDTFSRKISEAAHGTGDLYNFLRVNNVAIKDAAGQLLPLNTLLGKYADLVKNTKSPQDQLNEAFLVGGRQAGPELVGALREGAAGLERFGIKAVEAGVIIDEALIARAKEANEKFRILKLQLTTIFEEAALAAIEAFKAKNSEMQGIADNMGKLFKDAWKSVIQFIETNNPDAARIIQNLKDVINNAEITGAPLTGRRGGAEINAPIFRGVDQRFAPAPTTPIGDNTTKQFDVLAESFTKLLEAQQKRTELLAAEAANIGKTVGAATTYRTAIDLENEAIQKNIPLTAERFAQIQASARKTGAAAQALDDYKRKWQELNSALQFAGDQMITILDGLRTKTLTAADAMKQLANSIIKAIEQALILGTGPLTGLFGTASNIPGGTGGLIGALAGMFRANGGPVSAGQAYIVGENGPEFFVPDNSGRIIPNNVARPTSSSGANIVYAPTIDARGADAAAVARLASALANDRQNFESRVKSTFTRWRQNTPGAMR